MSASLTNWFRGYLNRRTPNYLIFFVTPYCACRCKMCFNMDAIKNAAKRDILSLDEIEKIARSFKGLPQINFSGGEPFMRPDFPEIVKLFYDYSGTRHFTIPTSSSHPDAFTKALERVLTLCPDAWVHVTQSLDAVGELHDDIRQRPGLFECVLDMNRRLTELAKSYPNLHYGLACAYSHFNRGHEWELLDYVYEHLDFTQFGALFIRGDTSDQDAKDFEVQKFVEFQTECLRRRVEADVPGDISTRAFLAVMVTVCQYVLRSVLDDRYYMPCHAGRRMVVLDDEGNVTPCEVLDYMITEGTTGVTKAEMGNIRDFDCDIRKLMNTESAKDIARQIVRTRCHCTFECAMSVNTVHNFRAWPRVLMNLMASYRKRKPGSQL